MLELACVMNQVKHVVVCGHSDCKAVNLLYDIHTDPSYQVLMVRVIFETYYFT